MELVPATGSAARPIIDRTNAKTETIRTTGPAGAAVFPLQPLNSI